MSTPGVSRGGAIATRGLLAQTRGNDQFDFLWTSAAGSHATQVKSTEAIFSKADVKLVLVGNESAGFVRARTFRVSPTRARKSSKMQKGSFSGRSRKGDN